MCTGYFYSRDLADLPQPYRRIAGLENEQNNNIGALSPFVHTAQSWRTRYISSFFSIVVVALLTVDLFVHIRTVHVLIRKEANPLPRRIVA